MSAGKRLSTDDAEGVAIGALAFIARDPEQLGRFLSLTGIGPSDLRAAAREAGFLAGVLEFVMTDESLLLAFAESAGLRPTMVAAARFALAGAAGEG